MAKCLACGVVFLPLGLAGAVLNAAIVLVADPGPLGLSALAAAGIVTGGLVGVLASLVAGVGLGALIPRPARAITLAVLVVAAVEPALIPRLDDLGAASYLPSSALAAVTQTHSATGFAARDLLTPGLGVTVVLSYAGVLALAGALALGRRDIA